MEGVDAETRASRLALCALTLRVLETGLDLLGVPVPEPHVRDGRASTWLARPPARLYAVMK